MTFTIIYHVSRNTYNLKQSLRSLENLEAKDQCELIIIDDFCSRDVETILRTEKLSGFKNIQYIRNSQVMGHAYSYNAGLKCAKGEYVYIAGANINFQPNFIKGLIKIINQNHADVISFDVVRNTDKSIYELKSKVYTELNDEFILGTWFDFKNKVISLKLIKEHKMRFIDYHWYPILMISKIFHNFKTWEHTNQILIKEVNAPNISYNIYDTIYQLVAFMEIAEKYQWINNYHDAFEFWAISLCLRSFVIKIYKEYNIDLNDEATIAKNKKIIALALKNTIKILRTYFPKFKNNKYLKPYHGDVLDYFVKLYKITGTDE